MLRRLKPQILLLAVLICLLVGCNSKNVSSGNNANTPTSPPNTALPMPPLNGASITNLGWTFGAGKRNVFGDFKGKVLVLDLYATWCEPCRKTVPHLIELQKKYEDQGLQVIGLNVGGPDDLPLVPGFAKDFGIQYPLARPDDELVTFLMGGTDAIPQTFVFDRQGQLAVRLVGYTPNYENRIDSAIEAGLRTPAP